MTPSLPSVTTELAADPAVASELAAGPAAIQPEQAGPPSARRVPTAGDLVAGRHRLQRIVASGSGTTLWRAVDEVLARPVAVKILHSIAGPDISAFLAAAIRGGRVSHPRVASVYDAVEEGGLAFVVSEWVDGVALAELLASGPLPTQRAVGLVSQAAQALAAVHAAGVAHRRLHGGNVLVGANGTVKLTDLELAAVVARIESPAASSGASTSDAGDPTATDVRALGALLYAGLTARWPLGGGPQGHATQLPAQPGTADRSASPRQLRAGVPRELDQLTMRILQPGQHPSQSPLDTAARVAQVLRTTPAAPPVAQPRPKAKRPIPSWRRWRWAVPLAAVAGIGAVAYLVGTDVGTLPSAPRTMPDLLASPSGQPVASHVLALTSVRDYDPQGDGHERPDLVHLAYDHDPSTAWQTATYLHTPRFGGLKDGIGLLVDLGTPTKVSQVSLTLTDPGATLELRAGDRLGSGPSALPTVSTVADSTKSATLTPRPATTARYWLVWITVLPPRHGGFGEGIAEMVFRGT